MVAKDKSTRVSSKQPEAIEGEFVVKMSAAGVQSLKSLRTMMAANGLAVKDVVNSNENVYLVKVANPELASRKLSIQTAPVKGGHGDFKGGARLSAEGGQGDLRASAIAGISSLPGVELVEPNFIYRLLDVPTSKPNDAEFTKLWGLENVGQKDKSGRDGRIGADIGATKAWALNKGSRDVVVAVIDTGVDYNHPDLKDNIWSKPGSPDVHGYNAITDKEDPMDDHSHGTHCAGTIGGTGDNGVGVVGVNWNVSIMGAKFLTASGSGSLANAIKAIDYATNNGARILSNSWGGGGFSQTLKDAISRANDKGILFIAAAGNDSSDNDARATYPANYDVPNVIAVAASNNVDGLAYFSNWGARSVLLMAPGENIFSTVINGGYDTYSGTSMATPHVSGATALLLAHQPSLTVADVKERLGRTSEKLRSFRSKISSAGRLNVYNLLADITPPGLITIPDTAWSVLVPKVVGSAHPYAQSSKQSWTIEHPGAKYLRVKFGRFETEAGYDIVTVKSGSGEEVASLSGTLPAGTFSSEVEGEKLVLEFESDSSVNGWGFEIQGYTWTDYAGLTHTVDAR
jgi:subtilisin family serine protease